VGGRASELTPLGVNKGCASCEFLRAKVYGHIALREYAIHFPSRKIGELCGLAQAENALRIKRNGKLQSQPLDLFQIRQAKRIGYLARDFESQGLRHSHHRSGGKDPMQALSRGACLAGFRAVETTATGRRSTIKTIKFCVYLRDAKKYLLSGVLWGYFDFGGAIIFYNSTAWRCRIGFRFWCINGETYHQDLVLGDPTRPKPCLATRSTAGVATPLKSLYCASVGT
jgi:hypothetical protein